MKAYDPIFDQRKRPEPDHEHQWVQSNHRIFEVCAVEGCSTARYSRGWLDGLLRNTLRRSGESS